MYGERRVSRFPRHPVRDPYRLPIGAFFFAQAQDPAVILRKRLRRCPRERTAARAWSKIWWIDA
jgi:hypothetical protein